MAERVERKANGGREQGAMFNLANEAEHVKALFAYVPEGFNAAECLPGAMLVRADSAHWLLDTIIHRACIGRYDEDGFVGVDSRIARDMMGRRMWPAIRTALSGPWLDEQVRPHIAGVRCRGYRLNPQLSGGIRRVQLTEPGLCERLRRFMAEYQATQESEMLPIHAQLREAQCSLTIRPEADAVLNELVGPAHALQSALVATYRNRRLPFSVAFGTGRVFNSLTGLKSDLREHVRLAGQPIGCVDLSGAQPALLGLMLTRPLGPLFPFEWVKRRANIPPYPFPHWLASSRAVADRVVSLLSDLFSLHRLVDVDTYEFSELACAGSLYEYLVDACHAAGVSLRGEPRRWVKKRVLVDVLNYDGSYKSDLARVVGSKWPSVLAVVHRANASHRTLIATLQRLESRLVIELVAPRLVERVPIVSLHDAIYCRLPDQPAVVEAFEETFAELGFRLSLKCSPDLDAYGRGVDDA